eukprot:m.25009 g.25009  ORF g.25009 m.25009 type:complete len:167 (+) comp13493_c0_seq1:195-695(+)
MSTDAGLCTNCNQFFGNSAFNGMCSSCYKAVQKKTGSDATPTPAPPPVASTIPAPSTPLPIASPTVTAAGTSPLPEQLKTSEATTQKPKKKRTKCSFGCGKSLSKVQQMTNKCRCDLMFCDAHRDASKHSCTFNYKDLGRKEAGDKNPKLDESKGRGIHRLESMDH